jgi:hypothetical protein
METRNVLVNVKCIIFIFLTLFISGCATYKQYGYPSELLGTWYYAFEDSEGFYVEQAYTFDEDGKGTLEIRQYDNIKWAGTIIRVLSPENITIFNISPSSQKGKIKFVDSYGSYGQIPFKIVNNYLVVSGFSFNMVDQSKVRNRKLSETEVEKWINANGTPFSEM